MNEKFTLQVDVEKVKAAAAPLFSKDSTRTDWDFAKWSKKAKVSVMTLRTFLHDKPVKIETALKIARSTGLPPESVLTIGGKRIVA